MVRDLEENSHFSAHSMHSDGMHVQLLVADYLLIMCMYLGFSAGGSDLLFENNRIVNGDDCLTVGNGAKNIIFRRVASDYAFIETRLLTSSVSI